MFVSGYPSRWTGPPCTAWSPRRRPGWWPPDCAPAGLPRCGCRRHCPTWSTCWRPGAAGGAGDPARPPAHRPRGRPGAASAHPAGGRGPGPHRRRRAEGLRRRHRGRHRLRRPSGGQRPRGDPAQLRLHRTVQGDRPYRRRPGRRGASATPGSTGWRCPASGSSCCRPWCTCSASSAACSTACTPGSSWCRRSGSAATPCWPRSPPSDTPGHRARRAVPHRSARLHPRRPAAAAAHAG